MFKKLLLLTLFFPFMSLVYSQATLEEDNMVTVEGYYYWVSIYHRNKPPMHTSVFAAERIPIEKLKHLNLRKFHKRLYSNNYYCQDIVMGYREYLRQTSRQNPRDFDYGIVLQDSIASHSSTQNFKIRHGYKCTIEESKIKGLCWFVPESSQMSDEIPFAKLRISTKSLILIDLYYAKEP